MAYDIRHLPAEQVGTRTYAVSLGRALAELPGIELTLLANWPSQAEGLKGRLVLEDEWRDDVAVIHKPAQVFDWRQLKLLFESSSHIIITYQDLIAYRIASTFGIEADFERYRTTSTLSIQASQRFIAYSETARREIAFEFCIPPAEIAVIPLGVEAPSFARREPDEVEVLGRLGLPERYFFSLATDFPHKNLTGLLDAYALLRSRWTEGDPPGLATRGLLDGKPDEPLRSSKLRSQGERADLPGTRFGRRAQGPVPTCRSSGLSIVLRRIWSAALGGNGSGHSGHRHAILVDTRSRRRLRIIPQRSFRGRSGAGHGASGDE